MLRAVYAVAAETVVRSASVYSSAHGTRNTLQYSFSCCRYGTLSYLSAVCQTIEHPLQDVVRYYGPSGSSR